MLSLEVGSSRWGGPYFLPQNSEIYCYVYPLRMNQDSLSPCCLTASPLFLHSLTSKIKKCLNLPVGATGKSRRLQAFVS